MNTNSLFQQLGQLQVLVIGDRMIDRYFYGEVTETADIALLANLVGGQIAETAGVATFDKEGLKKETLRWNVEHT